MAGQSGNEGCFLEINCSRHISLITGGFPIFLTPFFSFRSNDFWKMTPAHAPVTRDGLQWIRHLLLQCPEWKYQTNIASSMPLPFLKEMSSFSHSSLAGVRQDSQLAMAELATGHQLLISSGSGCIFMCQERGKASCYKSCIYNIIWFYQHPGKERRERKEPGAAWRSHMDKEGCPAGSH